MCTMVPHRHISLLCMCSAQKVYSMLCSEIYMHQDSSQFAPGTSERRCQISWLSLSGASIGFT